MRRVVLLASARTGSTWLGESLSQHPRIAYDQEILLELAKDDTVSGPDRTEAAIRLLTHFLLQCRKPVHVWKYQQWQHRQFPGFLSALQVDSAIFLRRQNLFEWLVSNRVAKERRIYTRRIGDRLPAVPPFRLDPCEAERAMRQEIDWWSTARDFCASVPSVEVLYEDLVADFHETVSRCFRIAGCSPIEVATPTLKMQTLDPRRQVENYPELQERFACTEFQNFGFC